MNSISNWYFNYITLFIERSCNILGRLPSKFNGQILMFHHVSDENVDSLDCCKCTISRFEEILNQLRKEGSTFISVDQLLKLLKREKSEKFVVITFDDGTDDLFWNAYPILKRMHIPFIVYVTTDFINKQGFLNDEQLDLLNNEVLCTIGSHTITHPMLRYSKDAYFEISQSKKLLEKRLGKRVDHFAYPYGKFGAVSLANIRMAKKSGYKSAMGTIETSAIRYFRKFIWFLPRIVFK